MTFLQFKARLAQIAHRGDLTARMVDFAADATQKINRRFNLELVAPVADTDTNEVLEKYPLLYVYSGLQSLFEYLNNGDNARYYHERFELEADRQNITSPATITDTLTVDGEPPVITGA